MAITTSAPHITRSKRSSEPTGVEGKPSPSATLANTKLSAKSKTSTRKTTTTTTTTTVSHTVSKTGVTKSTRTARPVLTQVDPTSSNSEEKEPNVNIVNDDKENIDPATGLDPLQTLVLKSGKKKGLGLGGRGGNIGAEPITEKTKRAAKTSNTTTRKSRASLPTRDENDTIAGRLIAMRRREAPEDRIARELTVLPLVDLSEAYGIIEKPIIPSKKTVHDAPKQTTQEPKGEQKSNEEGAAATHALVAADLQAALRLLAETMDEHRRLPTVLQRPVRGIKRAIHSPATSVPLRGSTSSEDLITRELRRLSSPAHTTGSSSSSRPTKRMRKSAPGVATPKLTTMPDHEDANVVPCVPPNSPISTPNILPFAEEFPTSTSAPIPIPSTSRRARRGTFTDEEAEETQETSFENTQGSSHFSSIFGSASFRLGASFNVERGQSEEEERDVSAGSWSRWL